MAKVYARRLHKHLELDHDAMGELGVVVADERGERVNALRHQVLIDPSAREFPLELRDPIEALLRLSRP